MPLDYYTITDLARLWGVDLSVASRRVSRSGIQPAAMAGHIKLYRKSVAARLAKPTGKVGRPRKVRPAAS